MQLETLGKTKAKSLLHWRWMLLMAVTYTSLTVVAEAQSMSSKCSQMAEHFSISSPSPRRLILALMITHLCLKTSDLLHAQRRDVPSKLV